MPLWFRICRSFWLPLGIFLFLWIFISPLVLKGQYASSVHEKEIQEEKKLSRAAFMDVDDMTSISEIVGKERNSQHLEVNN